MSSEFVWRMEDVLDLYEEPYNPKQPVVCFDERPFQLTGEVHHPQPVKPGQPMKYDYEYKRNGTCNMFSVNLLSKTLRSSQRTQSIAANFFAFRYERLSIAIYGQQFIS